LVIIIGSVLFALLYPPIYVANCSIILKGGVSLSSPESIEKVPSEIGSMQESDLYSEIEIITANVVAQNAAAELLKQGFEFGGLGTEEDKLKKAVNKIKGSLEPAINPRSNTITIKTIWGDQKEAKRLLEAVLDSYFEYRSQIFKPREAETFFAAQLEQFSKKLEQKEMDLRNLTINSQTPNAVSEIQSNLLNMANLERQLYDLKQENLDQKSRVDLMEKDFNSGGTNYFSYVNDPQIKEMSNLVLEIIKQRNEAARIFHPKSEKIQNYNKQIAAAMGTFKVEIGKFLGSERAGLKSINNKIEYIADQIKKIREKNMGLYEASTKSKMLDRQIAVLEDSYTTFTKRLEEAKISNNYKTNKLFTVSLLTRPETSDFPVFPNKKKVIMMGILAGIIAGIAVGFLMEFFNHTFKTPEDVENNTDMAYIFSIPE